MTSQEIFKKLLEGRGIKDVESYLNPDYELLGDPKKLPDIKKALKRIKQAIDAKETIAIYGDYDIDGLTATAMLYEVLAHLTGVITFIPDRFEEGYGLSESGIESLASDGAALIITVDCGSRSEAEVAFAAQKNIDVIITDHHNIAKPPKSAVAVINPKRSDNKYSYVDLSGAGVAFALVRALQDAGIIDLKKGDEKWLLDLVALSTVCDIVDLTDENRTLVKYGLIVMNKTRRAGLKSLIEVSDTRKVDEVALGFRLGPRLNAAGRLKHAKKSLDLLLAADESTADKIAEELDKLNSKRRSDQDKIFKEAKVMAEKQSDKAFLLLTNPKWSHGINGIVAAKIVEDFGKPAFVMQELEDGTTKGSARSVRGFDLGAALKSASRLLISGGGHKYAAGATIKSENLTKFGDLLDKEAKKAGLDGGGRTTAPKADIALDGLEGVNLDLAKLMEDLKPFGKGNPEPIFKINDLKMIDVKAVGGDKTHGQATLEDSEGIIIRAIGFSKADAMLKLLDTEVSVLGRISVNDFNGRQTAQLVLVNVEAS